MPSENQRKIESIAWNTIDKYRKDNPKPRLSARTRHRMKMWLVSFIPRHIDYGVAPPEYVMPLEPLHITEMLSYARLSNDD